MIQKIKNRFKFIVYWIVVGILLSPITLLIGNVSFFSTILLASILGFYGGFGFSVVMGYYSSTTQKINRAKISGLSVFFVTIFFVIMTLGQEYVLSPMVSSGTMFAMISVTICKLVSLIAILLLKPIESSVSNEETISYKAVLKTREVLLYFLLWLMFSVVNNFVNPVLYDSFGNTQFFAQMTMVETVLSGILAILFGFLADRVGRKRLLFIGFVLLGLGYALLGLLSAYPMSLPFYTILDALAWSIFSPIFLLTIWGDIADKRGGEKFYVIGVLPYLLSNFLQIILGQYSLISMIDLTTIFTFVCIFLFIAVIPLFLAPETLPVQDVRELDLRKYYEKVKEKAKKDAKNLQLHDDNDNDAANDSVNNDV
ncbi:MAG: hypothetical protein LBH62_04725 [Nitrososphaerota archaeon]|nr:hypothetical protein [Nitrososphaerota archaeon]